MIEKKFLINEKTLRDRGSGLKDFMGQLEPQLELLEMFQGFVVIE